MSLMSYEGHFKDGKVVLPKNVKIPAKGKFTITFKEHKETEAEIAKRQRAAFEEFVKNIAAIDGEPLGEEFDKAMKKRLKFRTPEELDLL